MIYDVFDMEGDAAEEAAVPDVGPTAAVAAPLPAVYAVPQGTWRESEGLAVLQGARDVAMGPSGPSIYIYLCIYIFIYMYSTHTV